MTGAAGHHRIARLVIQLVLIFGLSVPVPAGADGLSLLSLSARIRISNSTTLGQPQPEEFDEYTMAAHFGLPWQNKPVWGVIGDTRLMASAGLMQGAGETGVIVSAVPMIGLRHQDWPILLDAGAGGALLSRYEVGTQDLGGPFQFALTVGVSGRVYKRLGIGYRFMHYSDAGLNGDTTVGADFHMLECYYHF